MNDDVRELIACEDVLMFVNAATTSTGQAEFYSDSDEQQLSLDFLHSYVLINYRELYAASLTLGINDHNAARIILNLLSDRASAIEARLVACRLRTTPPQRVYRLFRQLQRARVNNRRTRAVIGEWLRARPDLGLDAVKYRAGLKAAVRHARVRLDDEIIAFLFEPRSRVSYSHPLLDAYRRARYQRKAIFELPYTVAEGFAAQRGIDRETLLEQVDPKLTDNERLRLHNRIAATRSTNGPNLAGLSASSRMSATRVASYVLSLPFEQRIERREELTEALRIAASRSVGTQVGEWGRVAAVLDDSFSAIGSAQKRRRPLAVALATDAVLRLLARDYRSFWLSGTGDALLTRPAGTTGLGKRILDALETEPDLLLIVSDGWDNDPPGLAAEVLRVWRTRLDPDRRTRVVHLNPAYDADTFDVRRLSPGVPTMGVRDADDVALLAELARFGEGDTGFTELRAHLNDRIARFVDARS